MYFVYGHRISSYCEEGNAFSVITEGLRSMSNSVLDLFKGKDRKLAERAKTDLPDDVSGDPKLSKEKLEKIHEKYSDRLKEEI